MKFSAWAIIGFILLGSKAEAAEQLPKYLLAAPSSFCLAGERVDTNIKSCEDNSIFVKAAKKCFADFKTLRKVTAQQLEQRFAKNNGEKQKQDFANHASDNQEAIAAHKYLIAVGETALKELDDYFDYMEQPEDAMNDDEILAEPCFIENAEALDQLMNDFEDEVDAMKAAKDVEATHSFISTGNKKQIDANSANPQIKSTTGNGSGTIKGGTSANRESDVSGIEESKKKNEK